MKVIRTNKTYSLYNDDMETLNRLPNLTFTVEYSRGAGFFLQERGSFEITEKKVYGIHIAKVDKILNSFKYFNRNLGVILSGNKGIGKSLFVKMLALEAIKRGLPVITVNQLYDGLSTFIDSIQQEVLVIFDEFDKNFPNRLSQNSLLGLFDGMSSGKKLFAITCNSTKNISQFLIGRPGRFHYHIRFKYPQPEAIKEYLEDNVEEEFRGEIPAVLAHSLTYPLNFDALRAIVFELNLGTPFVEAMEDLNIVSEDINNTFSVLLLNGDEPVYGTQGIGIDFARNQFTCYVHKVATYKEGTGVFIGQDFACSLICKLDGFTMDLDSGIINVPAENITLRAVSSKKDEPVLPVTKIWIKSEGFGASGPKISYRAEDDYDGEDYNNEEDENEEVEDRLGFVGTVGELDGLEMITDEGDEL